MGGGNLPEFGGLLGSFQMKCCNTEKAYEFVTFFPKRTKITVKARINHISYKNQKPQGLHSSEVRGGRTFFHLFTICIPQGDFSVPWWSSILGLTEKLRICCLVWCWLMPSSWAHITEKMEVATSRSVSSRNICIPGPVHKCPLNLRGFFLCLR